MLANSFGNMFYCGYWKSLKHWSEGRTGGGRLDRHWNGQQPMEQLDWKRQGPVRMGATTRLHMSPQGHFWA
eukprot:670218-Alexandrium_andersonii.AAC.1